MLTSPTMAKQLRAPRVRLAEIILDEANLIPAFVMMAMLFCFEKVERAVIVGDPAQSAPFASTAEREISSTFTMVTKAFESTPDKIVFLETQHRMPSPIGNVVSSRASE
jgi:hypothetical protein